MFGVNDSANPDLPSKYGQPLDKADNGLYEEVYLARELDNDDSEEEEVKSKNVAPQFLSRKYHPDGSAGTHELTPTP